MKYGSHFWTRMRENSVQYLHLLKLVPFFKLIHITVGSTPFLTLPTKSKQQTLFNNGVSQPLCVNYFSISI